MFPFDQRYYAQKLDALRADIDEGLRSLDARRGIGLDIEVLIEKKNAERGLRQAPTSSAT